MKSLKQQSSQSNNNKKAGELPAFKILTEFQKTPRLPNLHQEARTRARLRLREVTSIGRCFGTLPARACTN